jgi:hypothetical protein
MLSPIVTFWIKKLFAKLGVVKNKEKVNGSVHHKKHKKLLLKKHKHKKFRELNGGDRVEIKKEKVAEEKAAASIQSTPAQPPVQPPQIQPAQVVVKEPQVRIVRVDSPKTEVIREAEETPVQAPPISEAPNKERKRSTRKRKTAAIEEIISAEEDIIDDQSPIRKVGEDIDIPDLSEPSKPKGKRNGKEAGTKRRK